jgi:hypothetical protein
VVVLVSLLGMVDTHYVDEWILGVVVHQDRFDVNVSASPSQPEIVMVISVIPFWASFTNPIYDVAGLNMIVH